MEIDSSNIAPGVLRASAAQGIFLEETAGDLHVARLTSSADKMELLGTISAAGQQVILQPF